jgi:hypothetical protein
MNKFLSCVFILLIISLKSFGQCEVILPDTFVCHFGNNITLAPNIYGSSLTKDYRIDELSFEYIEHQYPNYIQLEDDFISQAINIGFEFEFYGFKYSQIFVGSNGWIGFSPNQSVNYLSEPIPSTEFYVPKNAIFAAWEDWNPNNGGLVSYESFQINNEELLVVSFENISHYVCDDTNETQGTFQIVLNKSDNSIAINILNKSSCLSVKSLQGIINIDGSTALAVDGRNSSVWSADSSSIKYTPSNMSYFNWFISDQLVLEQDSLNLNFFSDQEITLQYWDDLGCYSEVDFTVSVLPEFDINVNRVGEVLYSSLVDEDNFSYQWYFENEEIEGETSYSTLLNEQGQYFVQLQNLENRCYYNSRFHLYLTSDIEENKLSSIDIFPQPSDGNFSVKTDQKILKLQVFDYKGVRVKSFSSPKSNKFNLDLKPGIYFAHFDFSKKKIISRLIISK